MEPIERAKAAMARLPLEERVGITTGLGSAHDRPRPRPFSSWNGSYISLGCADVR